MAQSWKVDKPEEEMTKHDRLKYRLRNRIEPELFEAMPEEVQNFLIDMDPADVKEAYITTLLKLPWKTSGKIPDIDLNVGRKMLDYSHYGMTDVKEKVLRYMACQKHLGKNYGAVLLLVGPPGVGKTSIAASVARAMGRPCVKISLAGVSDALFLRGSQIIFHNAKPGNIVEALCRSKTFCPLILLDEIDKMGSSMEHGSPENVLLDVLDNDRSAYVDNFLNIPLDLSNVIFMCTANETESLSPILKDRLDIVELPPYRPVDKKVIVVQYVWPRLIREYNLDVLDKLVDPMEENPCHPESLELEEDAIEELIRMCPEDGVRDLERICRMLCESVISLYYAKGEIISKINCENLKKLLGPIYYS